MAQNETKEESIQKTNIKNKTSFGLKAAYNAAFPITIPVLTGYTFMSIAFGILMASKGYNALWAGIMGIVIYAGSGQYLAVGLLSAGFNPLVAFFLTLAVNARHLFYGISMLDTFKKFGRLKYYLIFSLTDETFALLTANKTPKGISEELFFFAVSSLNQFYWVVGCFLGGIIGQALPINTTGIDFVMTALFIVIFLEQWQKVKTGRIPAIIGFVISLISRIFLGPQWFLLGAMPLLVFVFLSAQKPIEKGMKA